MELSIQANRLCFLKQVLQDIRYQEETAETIVPDSYPDMAAILDSYAVPVIRGKDCRNGSIAVSGGIKGAILYEAEGNKDPRVLDVYLPFHIKAEHPALTSTAQVCCDVRIRSVDGSMINSRKALLRVNLSCMISVWDHGEETVYSVGESPDWLQSLERTYPLHLNLEACEKSFSLHETLELPPETAAIASVYKFMCRPELTDQKVVGNKAVFRGNLCCKLVYLSEDQQIHVHQFSVPFSQYGQLEGEYDEDHVTVYPVLTGFDLTLDQEVPSRRGEMVFHVLGQCLIHGIRQVTVLEDAYSTMGRWDPVYKPFSMNSCLDQQRIPVSPNLKMQTVLSEVVDTELYVDFPALRTDRDQLLGTIGTSVHILGHSPDHTLSGTSGIGNVEFRNPISEQVECVCWSSLPNGVYTTLSSNLAEVFGSIAVNMTCFGGQTVQMVSSGEWVEEDEQNPNASIIILKRCAPESSLWELAKSSRSKVEAIREINQLETDFLPAGQMLLIPVG